MKIVQHLIFLHFLHSVSSLFLIAKAKNNYENSAKKKKSNFCIEINELCVAWMVESSYPEAFKDNEDMALRDVVGGMGWDWAWWS